MTGPDEPVRDYRYGRKTNAPAVASGESAPERPRRRWKRNALGLVTLLLSVLTLALLLAPLADETTLPPAVHGVWHTDAAGYEQRRFELRAHSLTFQVGNLRSAISRYAIARVRQSEMSKGLLFRVDYFDLEDEALNVPLTFEFVYRAAIPSEIVFAHQAGIVWRRVPLAPRPKPVVAPGDEPDYRPAATKRP